MKINVFKLQIETNFHCSTIAVMSATEVVARKNCYSISGATIPSISSQLRGSGPSDPAILSSFQTLKTC